MELQFKTTGGVTYKHKGIVLSEFTKSYSLNARSIAELKKAQLHHDEIIQVLKGFVQMRANQLPADQHHQDKVKEYFAKIRGLQQANYKDFFRIVLDYLPGFKNWIPVGKGYHAHYNKFLAIEAVCKKYYQV